MRTRPRHAALVTTVLAVSVAAPAAAEVINGTAGPDVLVGTSQADTIHGYKGADKIYGKAGADRIYGGRDLKPDRLYGGPGPDRIYAAGHDRVYAGRGNDVIFKVSEGGGFVTVAVWCGPGYDRVHINPWLLGGGGGCEKIIP